MKRKIRLNKKNIKEVEYLKNNTILITLIDNTTYLLKEFRFKNGNFYLMRGTWYRLLDWLYGVGLDNPYLRKYEYHYKKQRGFVIWVDDDDISRVD